MIRRRFLALVAPLLLAACAGPSSVSKMRFVNQPPVWRVNDRRDVKEVPSDRPDWRHLRHFDGLFFRRATHAMELHEKVRARSVNSIDEVPDSTWFTNRIGVRDVSLAELAAGPNGEGPDLSAPLTIRSAKLGGMSIGFRVKDRRGTTFIIKFEKRGLPILETATDVAVQRLLWACGYNVSENFVVTIDRSQLVLGEGATLTDALGDKVPLTEADVAERLAMVEQTSDGRYRVLASKFLPGRPVGGWPMEGVRADDPNDTIAHEHRREVRGLKVFFSWLQYTDVKEPNTLDVWVEDKDRPGKHFLVHYLIDFGKSFGAMTEAGRASDGYEKMIDLGYFFLGLPTLGVWKRPWEGTTNPGIRGVSTFDAEHYDPAPWTPQIPYLPFKFTDAYDGFWAAKILMRFTPAHIRTALEQGQYDDPRAVDYLVEVLVKRQRKTAAYYMSRIPPLDEFEVRRGKGGDQLCYRDLAAVYRLFPIDRARPINSSTYDYDGRLLDRAASRPDGAGGHCTSVEPSSGKDGYTIVSLQLKRGGRALPPVEVHLARDTRTSTLRIIGLNRR